MVPDPAAQSALAAVASGHDPTGRQPRPKNPAEMMVEQVPCAICGGSSTQRMYRKFDLEIARCTGCGLVYATPRLSRDEVWQRYGADYFWREYLPALGVEDGGFDLDRFDRRYEPMLGLIAAEVPPPARLFELGVGAGFFLKAAERMGWTVSGVEVSSEALAFARERLGLAVQHSSAETLDLPAASIDVVAAFEVAEHLFDPVAAFRAVRRILRPDGLLVVSTTNFDALSRLALGRDWAVLSPAEQLYYYSERTLRRLLERAGFGAIRFERRYAGFGRYETMNPAYTHAPGSRRARAYAWFVQHARPFLCRRVLAAGRGDTLLCLARAV